MTLEATATNANYGTTASGSSFYAAMRILPRAQREDIVRAVSASGYPAPETLEEFRTLVAEPILHTPARPHAVQGTRRPRPRKPHRR